MARIEPIPLREFTPELRQAFAGLRPPDARYSRPEPHGRPTAANILGTLAHHPELTRAYCVFNGYLLMNTTLSERHREIVILRVGAVRESAYEWAQHISLADDAGLTATEIGCISFGPNAPVWGEQDKAVLQAVDDLLLTGEVSDQNWDSLTAHLTTQQILDLIFTVGSYDTMSKMTKSLRVEIDADLAAFVASLAGKRTEPEGPAAS
jgi:alkylhydroperoxidase family enzyme